MTITEELIAGAQETAQIQEGKERRIACENDFYTFCTTYFPHYFGSEPAPYQRIIMDVVSKGTLSENHIQDLKPYIKENYHKYMHSTQTLSGIIDAEPRGFGKSTRFSLAFPLWLTIFKKKQFPILFASSQTLAEENLANIKEEIEDNELLFEDFGELKGAIWKANKITLSNGTAIAARGAGTSVRGVKHKEVRPDAAICDDIMTDDIAATKAQRDKRYRWFKRVVLPLGRDILPVLINTIFHEDDIICRLFKELEEGKLKGWVGFRFAARTESGESLWPSYWTDEALQKKQDELGSSAWATEMMNEPLSAEDAIIQKFHFYELERLPLETSRRFGGIDPATGVHDKCAFCTLVSADDGVLYVADSWAERLTETPFLERLIATFLLWRHSRIGFEDVAFQGIYKNNLVEKAAQQKVWLPITGRKTGGLSKSARIKEMAPLIEAGFIRFRQDQKELVEQLSLMTADGPRSAYDDDEDALWYAFKEAQEEKNTSAPVAAATNKVNNRRVLTAQSVIKTMRGLFHG